jgi:hypothetical protein
MRFRKYFPMLMLAASITTLAAAPTARAGLLVNQRSNGLPGMSAEEIVAQRLFIGAGAMRLNDLREGGRYIVVRLEDEVFWEIDPTLRMYTEQGFASLRKRREKAERERELKRRQAVERLEETELEAWLLQKGLRRDGKRIVTTEHLGVERVSRWHAQHVRISLNQKPVIDLWTTDEISEYEPPAELFDLYDKVGLFADDITRALREVSGFPVRIHADIDFDTVGATLNSEVQSVHDWPEDASYFALPEGLRLVERFPERPVGDGGIGQATRCAHCDTVIEDPIERIPGSNEYVCSRTCLLEHIKGLRRQPNGQSD